MTDSFTRAEKNSPIRVWGYLRVDRRISRSGFRLSRLSGRRVLDDDLLTFVGGIMASGMPLLHVFRDMRL